MGDVRRLRKPGRAGGVDVQGVRIERGRRVLGRAEQLPGHLLERRVERLERLRAGAATPNAQGGWQVRLERRDAGGEPPSHDHQPGRGDPDAMGERIARQMGVEQGHGDTQAREPEPGRHILRAVGHEQGRHIAALEPLQEAPAGIAVRALREIPIAQ